MINAPGQMTGSATQLFSAISVGTDDWGSYCPANGGLNQKTCHKTTVTGHNPTSGYVWLHDIQTGKVEQIADIRPSVQYKGSYSYAITKGRFGKTSIPAAVTTLGGLEIGDYLDTGTGSGDGAMGRKVSVWDGNGDEVSPGEGNSWRLLFSTGEVTAVSNSTSIESYKDEVVETIVLV